MVANLSQHQSCALQLQSFSTNNLCLAVKLNKDLLEHLVSDPALIGHDSQPPESQGFQAVRPIERVMVRLVRLRIKHKDDIRQEEKNS